MCKIHKKYRVGIILSLLIMPGFIGAQQRLPFNTAPLQGVLQGISITLEPNTPRPFSTMTISLKSVRHDLSQTFIRWEKDGRLMSEGVGNTQFSFATGAVGESSQIKFYIMQEDTLLYADSVEVSPSQLGIAWEAETYTPPFYRGKALAVPGSRVRLIALPFFRDKNGAVIDPSTLVYTWKIGTKTLVDDSGYGKQVLELEPGNPFGLAKKIILEVESVDGTFSDQTSIILGSSQPLLRFYQVHPLRGVVYEHSLSRLVLTDEETVVLAEPYFFSIPEREDEQLLFEWDLDGSPFTAQEVVTLQKPQNASGSGIMRVKVRSRDALLQRANNSLFVSY